MRILNAELDEVLKISKERKDEFMDSQEYKEPEVTKPEIELKHEENVQTLQRPRVLSLVEKLHDFYEDVDPETGKVIWRNPHFDTRDGEPLVYTDEAMRDNFIKALMQRRAAKMR